MATYTIEDRSGVLEVSIRGYAGPLESLLAAFKACQEGRCACPTDEYENLESLDVETTAEAIVLRLKPKSGVDFDQEDIRACLDFTLKEAGKGGVTPD